MNEQTAARQRIGPITDTARPALERIGLGGVLERPTLREGRLRPGSLTRNVPERPQIRQGHGSR